MSDPNPNQDLPDWEKLVRAKELTVLLDLDGTLIPYAPTAEAAILDQAGAALLETLHEAGIRVVIVSGRPRALVASLQSQVKHAWWAAEHGAWRSFGDGDDWIGPPPAPELDSLVTALRDQELLRPLRIERKSLSVCVHFRDVAIDQREAVITAAELVCDEWLETNSEYERIGGVEIVEVRHRSAHKGSAVVWARERVPGAVMIAIGDDITDEDMFAELGDDELGIAVYNQRRRRSRGRAWLAGPAQVRTFLSWLAEARLRGVTTPPALDPAPTPRQSRARSRLVVVSNRTPPPSTGGRERPVGGLVSALEPALRMYDGIWLGWSGQERDAAPKVVIDDESRPVRASFDLTHAWRQRFYGGFCNRALWPLLHGFPSRVSYSDTDWKAYVEANEAYARHAAELVAPDGTVWVHDYHLFLVAAALRRHGFHGPVGLFVHVPFPGPDLFETLPWCDEVLAAMCSFDMIGFHTEQWASNFRACLARQASVADGLQLGTPAIEVLPIGIDAQNFAITDATPASEVVGLKAVLGERRLVLGVDRLDYSKGIPERLLGFERLLESQPDWRGKVSFVQISVPSRADVPEYAELRHRVENLVGRINGRFGEADWVPVRYLYRSYDHRVLAQLYRAADVALVTPLRDGLNLVAKEFVAAQDPAQPGVLILSKFAGAAAELTDALLTNPYHADGLAADLDRALRMPGDERRRRHGLLAAKIALTTPQRWAGAFLERLAESRRALA